MDWPEIRVMPISTLYRICTLALTGNSSGEIFFLFSHRRLQRFSCCLLTFRRRLSSVLSEFSHKNYFSRVSSPWMVSPVAVPIP